jgi:hypothetical protein
MTTPRAMLPTDFLALVSNRGFACRNEARPFERLGARDASPNPVEAAIEPWLSFATGRRAWISAHRGRLQGLVSVRRRGGRQAWEIDCLIDATANLGCLPGVLECATFQAGRAAIEKIFLRLPADSLVLPVVRPAGFIPYANETLYFRSGQLDDLQGSGPVREMTQQDLYPAFRLYNRVQPETRRRLEAATFAEWQASLEQRWLKAGVQVVSEDEGQLNAMIRAARLPQGLLVDVVATGQPTDNLRNLLGAAIRATGSVDIGCFALVGEESGLAGGFENLGFRAVGSYVSLLCRTTNVTRIGKLMPNIPRTAVVT